jgi:hypothetical protein
VAALTEPRRIADWLTAATVEPYEGGEIALDFGRPTTSSTAASPRGARRELAYEWCFPDGHDFARVVDARGRRRRALVMLVHKLLPTNEVPRYGAGGDAHLERLAGYLAGRMPDFQPRFEELRRSTRRSPRAEALLGAGPPGSRTRPATATDQGRATLPQSV